MSDVHVPGVGSVTRKQLYVFGGLVVVVGVAAYIRHTHAATVTAPDPNQTDASTGYPYGSAEDAAALAADGSYQSPTGGGYGYFPPNSNPTAPDPSVGFVTNAQWDAAALEFMSTVVGAPPGKVSAALGRYLHGENVDNEQKSWIEQSLAGVGYPPQSGTNGFPPSIRHTGATHPHSQLRAPVVHANRQKTHTVLQWAKVNNAAEYHVFANDKGLIGTTKSTRYNVASHRKGEKVYVVAINHSGGFPDSPHSNLVNVS